LRGVYHDGVRWLIDGYNVIRRSPELAARERESLEAGRRALAGLLTRAARDRADEFTVVFDGAGGGGAQGLAGVRVVFSSARESADRVLVRLAAAQGGAVVSSDREVLRAAERAGAVPVTAEAFLARLEPLMGAAAMGPSDEADGTGDRDDSGDRDESGWDSRGRKKGNPRRLGKKARAAARVLGRLGPRLPR
jgi:predicted RNA-binding protein with PIN domain